MKRMTCFCWESMFLTSIVDDDLIGSKKIHGMALKRIYEQAIGIQIQSRMRYKTICHCMDISIQISNKKKNEVKLASI